MTVGARPNGGAADTATAHIRRMDPLIRTMAAERVPPALVDDATQEARIAVWRTVESHADDPRPINGLLTVVARRAVTRLALGHAMTGEGGRSRLGQPRDPHRTGSTTPIDPTRNDHDPSVPDHAHVVKLRDAIDRALVRLAPWEQWFVRRRYLDDRPITEVAAELGRNPNNLSTHWTRHIRPVLRAALSDLREYV